MATLEGFIRTGHLGPVILGMSPTDAITLLGPADDTSRKTNPLLMQYGSVQLVFLRPPGERVSQLREIVIAFQPRFEPLPESLGIKDWNPAEAPSEQEFRGFIERIDYPPVHAVEGASDKAFTFLSGVTALVSDGMLQSLRLQEKKAKATPPAPVADEREATVGQIEGMLVEAEQALFAGASRAALMVAWAALEATLRRIAAQEGRQGKVGVAPHILLRELFATGGLSAEESGWLEMMRQARTAAAHGLALPEVHADLVGQLIEMTRRLLPKLSQPA